MSNAGMVRCPKCQAANAASHKTCDLCGTLLAPSATEPNYNTGTRQEQCFNCGANINESNVCPSCGRVQTVIPTSAPAPEPPGNTLPLPYFPAILADLPTTLTRTTMALPPMGWEITPRSDGRVSLRRKAWNRVHGTGNAGIAVAVMVFVMLRAVMMFASVEAMGGIAFWTGLAFVLLVVVLCVVGSTMLREELIVGPHHLEQKYTFLQWHWAKTVSGAAVLRIETRETGHFSRYGPRRIRTLRVENLGRKLTLETASQHIGGMWGMGLFGMEDSPLTDDAPAILARYLAVQTNWPAVDPARGHF